MATDLIAFLDESKKPVRDRATGRTTAAGDFYVVAAAIVLEGDLNDIRSELTAIETQLGFDLHYRQLRSQRRRIAAIEAINEIGGWDGYMFETAQPLQARHHSEHHIRAKTLTEAFTHLGAAGGVTQVTLETRSYPKRGFYQLDQKDHQVLQKLLTRKQVPEEFRIRHTDKTEPVLKLADLLAGARSDFLCGVNEEVYARIAHRVRDTRTVFNRP